MRFSTTFVTIVLAAAPALSLPTPVSQNVDRPVIVHEGSHITSHYASAGFKRQDGGDAFSGSAGSTRGGDSINEASGDGTVTNDGAGSGECSTVIPVDVPHLYFHRTRRRRRRQ